MVLDCTESSLQQQLKVQSAWIAGWIETLLKLKKRLALRLSLNQRANVVKDTMREKY